MRMVFFPLLTSLLVLGTIPLAYSNTSEEYEMLALINNERQARGLDPLIMNDTLSSAARLHSQDMIERNYFGHTDPDGLTSSDRARSAGYNFVALGENLCGNPSIKEGHSLLINSPSHSANILNPNYKEVGIGIVDGGPYGKMITQLFGTQYGNITTPAKKTVQGDQEKADIEIKDIRTMGQVEVLKKASLDVILTNSGKRNAESFVFAVFEGTSKNGNLLAKANVPHLYVGQEIVVNFEWVPPREGTYSLYFIADYYNNIREENKNNNTATYLLKVNSSGNAGKVYVNNTPVSDGESDLYILQRDISYNQMAYANIPSLISFKVRNNGNSPAFNVPLEVYINDKLKATPVINQVSPSSYSDVSLYLVFQDVGENNIEIKIDPKNTIKQSTNDNNAYFSVEVLDVESISNPMADIYENYEFIDVRKSEDFNLSSPYIINKTPEDVNISNSLKLTMNLKDIDASNAYVYYKYDNDPNSPFYIKRMNCLDDGSYFIDIDTSENDEIFYYFEVYTDEDVFRSPSNSPNGLYSCTINYLEKNEDFQILNIFRHIRRFFGLV